MDPQERFVTVSDGLKLFLRDLPAVGAEVGPPVLCLHGLTRNSRDFEAILPRIAAGGRRALALDVRGRGFSDNDPNPERYQPPTYVGDVIQVLDALAIPRAAFVGTSMGGLITMILAALQPQRIERVVLNDIGPKLEPEGLARIAGYVGTGAPFASWDEAAAKIKEINGAAFPDADDAFFAAMARRTCRERTPGQIALDYDPDIAVPFRQPGGAAPADLWALFEALKPIPALVVRGAISDLFSAATVAEMKAKKPDLESVEAARVGHAPMLDEPAAWDALARFLRLR
ncbi:MAG: alpha/beta hydrolase [Alphaproteobacteria bacterium]|nr:alpha/beta hydrolase [Alphaproteobacteria bacterium]